MAEAILIAALSVSLLQPQGDIGAGVEFEAAAPCPATFHPVASELTGRAGPVWVFDVDVSPTVGECVELRARRIRP